MVSSHFITTVVGIVGNATSLGLFLSPMPTFYSIWKKKTVGEFSVIPYLITFLNCLLWVLYGMPIVKVGNILVLTVNAAGAVIELFYILVYLLYSSGARRTRVVILLLLELSFIFVVSTVVLTVYHTREKRALVIGILCIIFCMLVYIAPLSVMRMVIRTKSVEYMPLYLSVLSFCNGLCWAIYSVVSFDANILIPNGIGAVFSIVQLVLYALYQKSTAVQLAEKKSKNDVADGDVSIGKSIDGEPVGPV